MLKSFEKSFASPLPFYLHKNKVSLSHILRHLSELYEGNLIATLKFIFNHKHSYILRRIPTPFTFHTIDNNTFIVGGPDRRDRK